MFVTGGRWRVFHAWSSGQCRDGPHVLRLGRRLELPTHFHYLGLIYGLGLLTACRRVLLDNPQVSVKKFPQIVWKPNRVQNATATGPHPKPDESGAYHTKFNSEIRFNIILIYVQVFHLKVCC